VIVNDSQYSNQCAITVLVIESSDE